MKRITSLAISLAILLTMASCNGNTPAQTPVGSDAPIAPPETAETAVTTGGASPSPTETVTETTTASEPTLPEFDINSEECLMYRLLDMTYEEIETEFGEEYTLMGSSTDNGDLSWRLYWDDETSIQITFLYSDHYVDNTEWNWYDTVKKATPSYVVLYGPSVLVYPGITVSMSTEDVSKIISRWDSAQMFENTKVYTHTSVNDAVLTVAWSIGEEHQTYLNDVNNSKTQEEMRIIRQQFANEFVDNISAYSANIFNISLARKN